MFLSKISNLSVVCILMTSFNLLAGPLDIPVRDTEGFHLKLSKSEAQTHCQKLKMRLPKLKEWVAYAVEHGARGFLEKEDQGRLFSQKYHTENGIYFYAFDNYRPTTEIREAFWISENQDAAYSELTKRYGAFSFDRSNGLIFVVHPEERSAFVCVPL